MNAPGTLPAPVLETKMPKVGTTIFTVMSALAAERGAVLEDERDGRPRERVDVREDDREARASPPTPPPSTTTPALAAASSSSAPTGPATCGGGEGGGA